MKLVNWAILIVTFLAVIWVLFQIELWAHDWKDLFFYQDNWLMYVFLLIMVLAVGMIIKKLYKIEFHYLK
jgi:hypothetical protein